MANDNADVELEDISGLTVQVTFDVPFCLYLEDGAYQVERGGWAASVQLERVAHAHLDRRLGIAETGAELVRDRYGRIRFSNVVVELPGKPVVEIGVRRQAAAGKLDTQEGVAHVTLTVDELISDYGDVAFYEALDAVNRLVEVYRCTTGQYQVHRIPSEEVFKADIQWLQAGELLGGTWRLGFGQGMTLEPRGFGAETMERLHSWLNSTQPIPVTIELLQAARDRLDRSEHRLAVIDARTALEVLVDEVLLGYFSGSGISLEEASRILNPQFTGAQTLEDALQHSGINRKLGHALKQALNLDLHNGSPELWQKWRRAKELREAGTHRGEPVDPCEANEAVDTIGEIIDNIRRALRGAPWMRGDPDTT